jgi:4-diphosphocytidyl-2-C-methyl-D-erythritol kinase
LFSLISIETLRTDFKSVNWFFYTGFFCLSYLRLFLLSAIGNFIPSICTIEAPCKINLHLSVGKKRDDGFHCIESIFTTLAFSDTLKFEISGSEGEPQLFTNWETPPEEIPDEKNLILRAISLFKEQTGFKKGLIVRLYKRIPLGAGLGGGSSDAAATFLALNLLSNAALPMSCLATMAASLGSDVPFFLTCGAAFVSGRGETVELLKSPEGLWVVLAKPPFASDTASAYGLLDRLRAQGQVEERAGIKREILLGALEGDSEKWPFYNDFLPAFLCREHSEFAVNYKGILDLLRSSGASFAGISGSGSCCFGVFYTKIKAEKAVERFQKEGNTARLTFFLAYRANPVLE